MISCVFASLPVSAPDREQLKIELQQVNQQISQQTRGMEVCMKSPSKFTTYNAQPCLTFININKHLTCAHRLPVTLCSCRGRRVRWHLSLRLE